MSEKAQAIARLVIALVGLCLVLLIAFDVVEASKLTTAVVSVVAILTEVEAWWRNNNVTDNAQQAQKYKNHLDSMGSE
jgi:hypothetical protein